MTLVPINTSDGFAHGIRYFKEENQERRWEKRAVACLNHMRGGK
jgi:hypothetical protein